MSAQPIATAIAQMEGWNVSGSLAQRNNNPGNLRAGKGQIGTQNGFAVFATPQAGWDALSNQIQLDASRGLTLQQFISKYAPASDNNNPQAYAQFVSQQTGIPVDGLLSSGAVLPVDVGGSILSNPDLTSGDESTSDQETVSLAGVDIPMSYVIGGSAILAGLVIWKFLR